MMGYLSWRFAQTRVGYKFCSNTAKAARVPLATIEGPDAAMRPRRSLKGET